MKRLHRPRRDHVHFRIEGTGQVFRVGRPLVLTADGRVLRPWVLGPRRYRRALLPRVRPLSIDGDAFHRRMRRRAAR